MVDFLTILAVVLMFTCFDVVITLFECLLWAIGCAAVAIGEAIERAFDKAFR